MKRSTLSRIGAAWIVATVAFALSACGTVVVANEFSLTINDPAGVLLAAPTEVSIFDSSMGSSEEWAQKKMGTTSPGNPYVTSFKTTDTRMIGSSRPSEDVRGGLAIPALTSYGYFAMNFAPQDGQTIRLSAPFIGYYDAPSAASKTPALPLEISAQQADLSWNLRIVVNVPTDWPQDATKPTS